MDFFLCVCVFFLPPKAQEIDAPLASAGRLATESELHMFSQKTDAWDEPGPGLLTPDRFSLVKSLWSLVGRVSLNFHSG